MKKENQTENFAISTLWDESELHTNEFMQWFQKNQRYLIGIVFALLIASILIYQLFAWQTRRAEKDYWAAAKDIEQLADPSQKSVVLAQLQEILHRRPQLQAKYDGMIAQNLLVLGDVETSLPFANRTFVRISDDHIPLYMDYAHNSYVIEQSSFSEALQQAVNLKSTMQNPNHLQSFGPMLYIFNLIRIGMLQKELGQMDEQKKTWQELMALSSGNSSLGIAPQDLEVVMQHVNEPKTSFNHFIQNLNSN